jgi:hypothetical protein
MVMAKFYGRECYVLQRIILNIDPPPLLRCLKSVCRGLCRITNQYEILRLLNYYEKHGDVACYEPDIYDSLDYDELCCRQAPPYTYINGQGDRYLLAFFLAYIKGGSEKLPHLIRAVAIRKLIIRRIAGAIG